MLDPDHLPISGSCCFCGAAVPVAWRPDPNPVRPGCHVAVGFCSACAAALFGFASPCRLGGLDRLQLSALASAVALGLGGVFTSPRATAGGRRS